MSSEFWAFMNAVLQNYGLIAVVEIAQIAGIVYLLRLLSRREKENNKLQAKLLELSEKRLTDAKEERKGYEDLVRGLDRSINLLVRAFREKNGR